MKIRIILTGATGMVGEGVMLTCLAHPDVEKVLVVGRRSCGVQHEKLSEILLEDFFDVASISHHFSGYNACFFCLGVSSVGMTEVDYTRVTYDLTLAFADAVLSRSPDLTFCYVSGAGTDSSARGRVMWARVKGRTENDLLKMPFKSAHMFRPAVIEPLKGQRNILGFYRYLAFLMPLVKRVAPSYYTRMSTLGLAMIRVVQQVKSAAIIESKDIRTIAGQ